MFAVSGIALSVISAWMMSDRDQSNITGRLETIVEARSALLQQEINQRLQALRPLTGAFAVDGSLARSTFQAFLRKALPHIEGLRRVNWLPRIGAAERDRFEKYATMSGAANFRIMDRRSDATYVVAPARPEYFPVVFSVVGNHAKEYAARPDDAGDLTLGVDYWSNPQIRALMARARDNGRPVASPPNIFDLGAGGRPEFLIFQPVYRGMKTPQSISTRRRNLIGFAAGRIDILEMFEASLAGKSAPARLDMYFFDAGADGTGPPLHVFESRLRRGSFTPVPLDRLRDALYWETTLDVGGQEWSVVFRPSFSGLPLLETRTAWAVLIGGVSMTLLITVFMLSSQRRNREIEGLLLGISRANAKLKIEIVERTQTEGKFRKLIEATPDATVVCDRHGAIVHINAQAEELFGYSKIELLGQKIEMLMPKGFRDGHAAHRTGFYRNSLARPMGAGLELQAVTKSGREFPTEISLGPIGAGDDWLVSASIRDITERKDREAELNHARERAETQARNLEEMNATLVQARDQAEAAVRTKSEFLTLMSHELRTPLNAVIGFSQIIRTEAFGPLGDPKYRQYMDNIFASGKHLLELIEDILDLTKIDVGRLQLDEGDVDVGDLIMRTARLLSERAVAGGVTLRHELAQDMLFLRADQRKLKRMLVCLMSNGIKFTEAGGELRVSARCNEKTEIEIEFRDTGIGMAPGDIPKALAPFGQIDSALTRQFGGGGLGLPLTVALVELHGGVFDLHSEPGVGTTATIRFPADRTARATPGTTAHIG